MSAYESGRRSPSVETLCRILAATGLEVRMRLVEPDRHDATRAAAESLLPPEDLAAFNERERRRVARRRARTSTSTERASDEAPLTIWTEIAGRSLC